MDAMAAGQLKHQTNIHDLHETHYNQRQTTRHPGFRQGRSRKECWYTCEWLETPSRLLGAVSFCMETRINADLMHASSQYLVDMHYIERCSVD
jgi:hypothetical protein